MGPLKHIGLLGVTLFLASLSYGQKSKDIPWDPSRKLSWEDFRGKPFKTAWAAATTASGISYEFAGRDAEDGYELEFTVIAFFDPNKSWYQPHLCDEIILSHEQLHFDISELYARKMRRELASARFTKNVKSEVQVIYRAILKEMNAFQDRYDKETNYSRNLEQQLSWNKKIQEALQ